MEPSCAITVSGFSVNVVYKEGARMTLYFDSKDGSVSVHVPPGSGLEEVSRFVESGIPWIESRRRKYRPGRTETVTAGGLSVEVTRTRVKRIGMTFSPETGAVRVSAPPGEKDEAIRRFIESCVPWLEKQRKKHAREAALAEAAYAHGSEHFLFGKRHVLNVIESRAGGGIRVDAGASRIDAYVEPGSSPVRVASALDFFHRRQMIALIPGLLKKWNGKMGLSVSEVNVKRMKTRWGSCTPARRRVWLSSRLATKPARAIDYVFAHEMAHLVVGPHNKRFYSMVGRIMPDWKLGRYELLGSDADSDLVD